MNEDDKNYYVRLTFDALLLITIYAVGLFILVAWS